MAETRKPVINPDGVSVKGCTTIYAPKGQAGEYARLATNPYRGCSHRCAYCYVPLVLKMDRQEFYGNVTSRPNYLNNLIKDAKKYQAAGITESVLLSFTTDVYNPTNIELTRAALRTLRDYGLAFTVLTKGGMRAIGDIDLFRPGRDTFAATLTSLDGQFSRKWEPGAALPENRIAALKGFHNCGVSTWVSLEPTLDADASIAIVKETHSFVNLYKIGKANYLKESAVPIDWRDYTLRMVDTLAAVGARGYFKKDLQVYLQEGYVNADPHSVLARQV